ncbi:MAG: hypothetical protein IPM21_18290 [Acidobacteria bacterium]|nr:hypothetical protein [Acidobacteriota bacterium]
MKKLTLRFLTIAIAVIAFSATEAIAQKRINLDSNGKATVSATVQPWKLGDIKEVWSISGKQFRNLSIKQTKGGKFKYEIHRGSQFLSSGHTTGSNITINSDGKSTYTITIINEDDQPRKIELSVVTSGGSNSI